MAGIPSSSPLALFPLLLLLPPGAQAADQSSQPLNPLPGSVAPAGDAVPELGFAAPIFGAAPAFGAGGPIAEAIAPQFLAQVVPTSGTVGTRVTATDGTTFEIGGGSQAGGNLFHRFDQLDLNAGQMANFLANPSIETIFSQIGGGPSSIDGLLKVSGSGADLFVINPAGILLGPNARLDLSGSFVATAANRLGFGSGVWLDLLADGFTAATVLPGSLTGLGFSAQAGGGAIANQGDLSVAPGQSIGLLGQAVVNTGELKAPEGAVTVLAAGAESGAGQQISLGGGLLNLAIAASQSSPLASSPDDKAPPIPGPNLVGEATNLQHNADGTVFLQAGSAAISGRVDVSSSSGTGGQVQILGEKIALRDAVVEASGGGAALGNGGEIRIGGDFQGKGDLPRAQRVTVDASSQLRADATSQGDGGQVIVWSDGQTAFAGTATARGGSQGGDGGLVETSGLAQLNIAPTAQVSTAAPQGKPGTWLLDPPDLSVISVSGAAAITGGVNSPVSASTIDRATLETALNGNNVELQATNSITVNTPIDTTGNAATGDLRLAAPTANLNQPIHLNGNLSGTATTVNVGANGGVQNGVDAVATGGTVNLAAATYREGQAVTINKSLTLQGQGRANTVMSGDANGDGTGDHRVMQVAGAGSNVVLQQLAIADGSSIDAGGGLTTNAGNLAIADAEFRNNQATSANRDGGAIHQSGGAVMITRSSFISNSSADDGGAIDLLDGALQISDSTFSQNIASSQAGAIDVDPRGTLSIVNSTFNNNTAQLGGAIFNEGVTTIDTTRFRFNNATGNGGAIANLSAQPNGLNLTESQVSDNSSAADGGGLYNRGNANISSTPFHRNTAAGNGGAIFSSGHTAPLTISGSSILSNVAGGDGGGLYLTDETQISNIGIGSNTAGGDGGSIYNSGNLSLSSLSVNGSRATRGGGIANIGSNSQTTVEFFVMNDNVATGEGGALFNEQGTIVIADGTLNRNITGANGGGFWSSGPVSTARLTITENQADGSGGGGWLENTTANIRATFRQNTAQNEGGGLRLSDANAVLNNSDFINNQAQFGGGIAARNTGTIQIESVEFSGNTAAVNGGAISNHDSVILSITDGRFLENQADDASGAINNSGAAVLTVDQSLFENNRAVRVGGGIGNIGPNASLSVMDSTFRANQANRGGAIYNQQGPITITDSLFESNVAVPGAATADGGAVYNFQGLLQISNSDFIRNQADVFGGAFLSNQGLNTIQSSTFNENRTVSLGPLQGTGGAIHQLLGTLTIADSQFTNNQAQEIGGAIDLNSVSDFRLSGSQIRDNQVLVPQSIGGGLSARNAGDVDIQQTTFSGNQAIAQGGAIYSRDVNLTLGNTEVSNNNADFGGGLYQQSGTLAIADSQFLRNQAQRYSGAIELDNVSDANISQSQIQGNQAVQQGGGAISLVNQTNLNLQQVMLRQNQANGNGGAISAQQFRDFSGTLNIVDSTIDGNISGSTGGGIYFNSGLLPSRINLLNSTVSHNHGNDSGAIRIGNNGIGRLENVTISGNQSNQDGVLGLNGTVDINHATIANNIADADNSGDGRGGGIFQRGGTIRLSNSIVANNQAAIGADLAGTFVDQGNNLIGISDGSSGLTNSPFVGTSAAPINPLLAPLADYGGLTQTMALLPGSPALDAGSSAVAADQRGVARVNAADIGAFESRGFIATAQAGTPQTAEVNTTFAAPLTVAISSLFDEPVDGGQVSFAAPTSGASIVAQTPTSMEITGGTAQLSVTANAIEGGYDVQATAAGMNPVAFVLTNTPVPEPPIAAPPVTEPPITEPPVIETPVTEPVTDPLVFPMLLERPIVRAAPVGEVPFQPVVVDSPLSFIDDAAIAAIDEIFSSGYTSYWDTDNGDGSPNRQSVSAAIASEEGSVVAQTRELLRQAEEAHGVNSAVAYALFVPQDKTADESFGAIQVASMALSRRLQTSEQRDDDQLMLILVPNAGKPLQRLVDVTRQELMQQVRLFRMAVSDPEDDQSYRPLARQMKHWLFEPIEPDVEQLELDNVMYALAPGLRTIPLAAMMDGDDYVIEHYGLSLIPSVDLLETNFGASPPPQEAIAAGASQFERLNDLPAVALELEAIARQREDVSLLFNQDFTREQLIATQNESQAKILHLATHAEFNAGDLGSSYLQFWDGPLTFDQIRQLGWDELELLILSACQTAISSPEAELGFAGLAAATGVESTIASLWSVSDVATLALMNEFYGQLNQKPLRFEALRQAQLAMMRGQTRIANQNLLTGSGDIALPEDWGLPDGGDFVHPFYWSGFTLVGNPWW